MERQYKTETLVGKDLDRIKIPKFQRGLVWSKSTKHEFIKTLHDGFPFGSLLVYPEKPHDPKSKLLLLDGQQRLNTINELGKNPLDFWIPLNKEVLLSRLEAINSELKPVEKLSEKKLIELLASDDISNAVPDWADDLDPSTDKKKIRKYIFALHEEIGKYIDLDSLQIPLIEFTGDKKYLPKVFENLNKGGVPLTKYEIFNASWASSEINLPSSNVIADEILDLTIEYYEQKIQDSAFDLDNFSRDEIKQDRKLTLAELGIALGRFIEKNLPSIVPQGTKNTGSELGFGILGIACNIDNKKLDELINKQEFINQNLPEILDKVDSICFNLNETFSKLLTTPSSRSRYQTGLSTTFKTLSYFSALWNLKSGSCDYIKTMNNLPGYYLYDHFYGTWAAHGDTRLYDYYPEVNQKNYLTILDIDDFRNSFIQWLDEKNSGINFNADTTAITAIHANLTYLSNKLFDTDRLEREHVIAKKKINSIESGDRKIFGNSIGNCMYLVKSKNNSKKDKNLYEFLSEAEIKDSKIQYLINESHYLTKEEFAKVDSHLAQEEYDEINNIIEFRARKIIDSISKLLLPQSELD
ncbi:DUF262 domain-containing protein [Rothia sp. LK2588]|uniref:DUF262 domain-containing protein n=1 Tax=Rothia sp. LK2588 TaxID=3114369 RepID=UPI0034CF63EA